MSSLSALPDLVGFFSYSREDDQGSRGGLSELRDAIQTELSAQLGRSQLDFRIWQDKAAISLGTLWEKQIKQGIDQSVFFIPIVTPRALRSQNCALEFQSFLARESELGRDDLVFPILYIPVPALEDEKLWRQDPVLNIVGTRQYLDWRELRHHDPRSTEVRLRIERYCRNISAALNKPWVSLQERKLRDEAEARQRAEEEEHRLAARRETERAAEAERQRRADEEQRARQAEAEARDRAEAQRRQQKAAAEQRAKDERAFTAAKRANSVAAMEEFLATHPAAEFAGEAQKLQAALRVREQACDRAMASDDPVVLRSFRDAYKKGGDVDRVRERLRILQPPQNSAARPAVLIPSVLAVLVIGAAIVWFAMRPNGEGRQASVAATSPPAAASPAPPAAPEPKAKVATVTPAVSPPAAATPAPPPGPGPDEVAWLLLKDTADQGALKRYIAQFPQSPRRKDAEAHLTTLVAMDTAWSLVKDSRDPDELRRFVQAFPNSPQRASAEQRIASLAAAPPPAPVAPVPDPHELARSLQFELMRVGCFSGTVNGQFDDATKTAWHRFVKLTSLTMPDDVSTDAINAVRAINKRVCPLLCPHGEHADGETCVANPEPASKRPVRSEAHERPAPAAEPAPTTAPNANAGCRVDRNSYAYSGVGTRGCLR
jgi:chemotaxis protein histidine kinase CheA